MTTAKCDFFMAILLKVFLNQIKSCEIKDLLGGICSNGKNPRIPRKG